MIKVMADFIMLRKGRNVLSSIVHVGLNIALAVVSTALTVISGNCVFAILLVILSKWRVIAVRPRYWWINIKSNLVDFIVGVSLALLVSVAGSNGLNMWHVILTIIYAIWLVAIKPQSSIVFAQVQSLMAIFFGTFAVATVAAHADPFLGCLVSFIIGYGASRHVLVQGDDVDFTLTTFLSGLILAELTWVFYHWSIVYVIGTETVYAVPQLPIVASLIFFTFARGYTSALKHDGKIRMDDILLPAIFSVSLILVMIFCFSKANFDV